VTTLLRASTKNLRVWSPEFNAFFNADVNLSLSLSLSLSDFQNTTNNFINSTQGTVNSTLGSVLSIFDTVHNINSTITNYFDAYVTPNEHWRYIVMAILFAFSMIAVIICLIGFFLKKSPIMTW